MTKFIWIFLVFYLPTLSYALTFESPCPNTFEYEPEGIVGDVWNGVIQFTLKEDVVGIKIKPVFNRPLLELGTNFGQVSQSANNEYIIEKPRQRRYSGETITIRIFVRFNPSREPPKLLSIELNSQLICPSDAANIEQLVSPCPSSFTYDPILPNAKYWIGHINVIPDSDLVGVWLQILFDKPPVNLYTNFDDTVVRNKNEFVVRNSKQNLRKGDLLHIHLNATFIPGEIPPRLVSYYLNGKPICAAPLEGISTTQRSLLYESPCPRIFTYDKFDTDSWVGYINFPSEIEFTGLWLKLIFDRQPLSINSNFGEGEKFEQTNFIIKNPVYKIKLGDLIHIHLTVRYKPGDIPPQLLQFRINNLPICPSGASVETTTTITSDQLISPCPETFTYGVQAENDRWYGHIHYKSDTRYYGFWVHVYLDRPAIEMGNWFGHVVAEDNNTAFLIKQPNIKIGFGETVNIKFYIKYQPGAPIPKVRLIRANGHHLICPKQPGGHGNHGGHDIPPLQISSTGSDHSSHGISSGGHGGHTAHGGHSGHGGFGSSQQSTSSSTDDDEWFVPTKSPNSDKPIFGADFIPSYSPDSEQCGVVANKPVALITNGLQTEEGKWPWHAALYFVHDGTEEYYCGGTLISLKHVLTVAHCATIKNTLTPHRPSDIRVYLGKYTFRKSNAGIQYKQVKRIFVHPNYKMFYYPNDIAILELDTPAQYTAWVRPVCLWSGDNNINSITDYHGTVVGWGYDRLGRVSDKLLKAVMPVVSREQCIWTNKEFFRKVVNENNFCAGFRNGTSVCTGDSGGGLVFEILNKWQVRGLVSLSVAAQSRFMNQTSLCDPTHYVVFTDVAKFSDWIKSITKIN